MPKVRENFPPYKDITPNAGDPLIVIIGKKEDPADGAYTDKTAPSLKKPPIGLRPKSIADEARMYEILDAIARYRNHADTSGATEISTPEEIPIEWFSELEPLLVAHNERAARNRVKVNKPTVLE